MSTTATIEKGAAASQNGASATASGSTANGAAAGANNAVAGPNLAATNQVLDALFREARSYSVWQDRKLEPGTIQKLYDLVKMGPTAANTNPARFIFIESDEAKQRLLPTLPEMNRQKAAAAPVVVIVAYDLEFWQKLDKLMPHRDYKPWYSSDPEYSHFTAFQSSSLQAAYLITAARALGLDAGPMHGNRDDVKKEFFPDKPWELNFVIALGYGVKDSVFPRLPRLDFGEAAQIL